MTPVSAVPREASLEIDIRDIDGPRRDGVVAAVKAAAEEIAERRKVRECRPALLSRGVKAVALRAHSGGGWGGSGLRGLRSRGK